MRTVKNVGEKRVWTAGVETTEAILVQNMISGAATAFSKVATRMIAEHGDGWFDANSEGYGALEQHLAYKAVPQTGVCALGAAKCRKWISFELPEGPSDVSATVRVTCKEGDFDTRAQARADAARCADHHQSTIASIEDYFMTTAHRVENADVMIARAQQDIEHAQAVLDKEL